MDKDDYKDLFRAAFKLMACADTIEQFSNPNEDEKILLQKAKKYAEKIMDRIAN